MNAVKYRKRPMTVEAVENTTDKPLHVEDMFGQESTANPGDFVVMQGDGYAYAMEREQFLQEYVLCTELQA